ncbi:MAG: hypothetical protein WBK67_00370 [Minisyncoccales bacterium]|jgi:hypothetical protein
MAIKFLKEKEKQETLVYLAVFIIALAGLIHFIGIDLEFKEPEVTLEMRENFLEIKPTIDKILDLQDFNRLRTFSLIPPFNHTPGRPNPFQSDGIESGELPEGGREDLFELPEGTESEEAESESESEEPEESVFREDSEPIEEENIVE